MRILYLMSSFPYPPHGGGALRIMGLLRGAAQAGHEIHVISLGDAEKHTQHTPLHDLASSITIIPPPRRTIANRLQTLLFTTKADMQRRSWSDACLAAALAKLDELDFDIVQLQSLEMGVYLAPIRQAHPHIKLVYDAYNAEAELQRMVFRAERQKRLRWPLALYSWIQWRRLRRFEGRLCQAADAVIAVSEADQQTLQALAGSTPVWLVNNGIDVADYDTPPTEQVGLQQPALVFTGLMDYRPNADAIRWFVAHVMPDITPEAHLYIVGNRPTSAVRALARHPRIHVTGFVKNIAPYLHEATVFIVPLRFGSGTRLKLLQAMSAGCAIVSSSVGAMGLHAEDDWEVMIADDPHTFAQSINFLLHDEGKRAQLRTAARAFVTQNFDWSVLVPRLLAAYESLARPAEAKRD